MGGSKWSHLCRSHLCLCEQEQDAPHRQYTLPWSWWHELCSLPLTLLCFVNVRVSQNEQICKSQIPSYVYWRESHHNPLKASPFPSFLPFTFLQTCKEQRGLVVPSLWLSGIHFYKGRSAVPVFRNGIHLHLGSSPTSNCCLGQGRIRFRIFHIIRNHLSSKRLELIAI